MSLVTIQTTNPKIIVCIHGHGAGPTATRSDDIVDDGFIFCRADAAEDLSQLVCPVTQIIHAHAERIRSIPWKDIPASPGGLDQPVPVLVYAGIVVERRP